MVGAAATPVRVGAHTNSSSGLVHFRVPLRRHDWHGGVRMIDRLWMPQYDIAQFGNRLDFRNYILVHFSGMEFDHVDRIGDVGGGNVST